MSRPTSYTVFMLVKTTDAWLALPPSGRFEFLGAEIRPLLERHPAVTMRFFDAEAFSARATDIVLWQTTDLDAYQSIVEGLRETKFWGAYFEVLDIFPTVENRYATHYDVKPLGG
ncbi:MAG: hypothetical protein JNM69_17465 [Archangium sp.]|nr:hypothetical protein [Archangium sp.]